MNEKRIGGQKLKKTVLALLKEKDAHDGLKRLCMFPARQVVNPLIQLLNSPEEPIKWRSVTALGAVVSHLAEKNMESAREVMRRLMWQLNSESGGIGWGSAEAMGEIMACHEKLANEYVSILLSYIDRGENFIENENLQKGILWALGRLGHVRPLLLEEGASLLLPFLRSKNIHLRGLAAWTARAIGSDVTRDLLTQLSEDTTSLTLYINGHLRVCQVRVLASSDYT